MINMPTKIIVEGNEWELESSYTGKLTHPYEHDETMEWLVLRRKKPEENKREGISTSIKTHYADQLVPTYEAFEILQRRVEELELSVKGMSRHIEYLDDGLDKLEAWRKAE